MGILKPYLTCLMQAFGRNQIPAKGGIQVSVFRCQVTNFNMQPAQLFINLKIFHIEKILCCHRVSSETPKSDTSIVLTPDT
jgi:hypothetical protein